MDYFTKENIGIALAIVGSWPVFSGWFRNIWSWNKNWKLARLQRERELFVLFKKSDRDLYLFLFSSILIVTTLLGMSLIFHAVGIDPDGHKQVLLSDWLFGFAIYTFSIYRLGQLRRLKNFDKTIAKLESEILKIQTAISNQDEIIDGGRF